MRRLIYYRLTRFNELKKNQIQGEKKTERDNEDHLDIMLT